MGSRNSMPASSASCARRMLLSQELTQRSGTFVTDMPPEQFGEKKPNFNLLSFRIGDCFRPMKPQATRLQDFTQLITCEIMPEIRIVQVSRTMKRWQAKYAGDVRARSPDWPCPSTMSK